MHFSCSLSLDWKLAIVRSGFLSGNLAFSLYTEYFFSSTDAFLLYNPYLKEGVELLIDLNSCVQQQLFHNAFVKPCKCMDLERSNIPLPA